MTELLDRLVSAVEEHYPSSDVPALRLSKFGTRHAELVQELKAEFGTLKRAIKEAGEDRLRFVDERTGSEAVAPAGIADHIAKQLELRSANLKEGAGNFDSLPLAVRVAFVTRSEAGEHIALDMTRPHRFVKITDPELIRPSQRIIAEQYRRPGLALRNATASDKAALWASFLAWADAVSVDPGVFQDKSMTALSRLLAAQPKSIISQVVIPADIAQLLLKHA